MSGPTVSWVSAVGGGWSFGSNWSSGTAPDSSTTATIALPGTIAIQSAATAESLIINNASASVQLLLGTLTLGGLLQIASGSFLLEGTLAGGTIAATGGSLVIGGFDDVLVGVTYAGTLTLGNFLDLTIDGLTLLGPTGPTGGVLALTGGAATFGTTQTLAGGTIEIGNYGAFPGFTPELDVASGATLTLAAPVLVQTTGDTETIDGTIINEGTIAASVSGDVLTIYGFLLNQGLIAVSGGDEVAVAASATLTNTGTITVATGGTLALFGGFTNTGTLSAAGGTLLAGGAVTQAELLALEASGGTVVVAGTLANAGSVLTVGSGAPLGTLVVSGDIQGGVIHDPGGGIVLNGGTLDGVTYRGTLAVTTNPTQSNAILDGMTLTGVGGTGTGLLLVSGGLAFANNESIAAGVIDLGGAGVAASLGTGANVTATLGPGVDLEQTGGTVALGGSFGSAQSLLPGQTFVSQGTLDAGIANGVMTLDAVAELVDQGLLEIRNGATFLAQGTLVNAGTVLIASGGTLVIAGANLWSDVGTVNGNGGTVVLAGSITTAELLSFAASGAAITLGGQLNNAGGTLNIGIGAALKTLTLGAGGTILGGVVHDGGAGLVGASGLLDGVTYRGTLGLTAAGNSLAVADGLTVTGSSGVGSGTIALTGNGAALTFTNNSTLSASVQIGGAGSEADLVVNSSTLTLAAGSSVTQTGALAGFIGGTVVNAGSIQAGLAGGTFEIGGVLRNTGTVSVASADFVTVGSLVNAGQVTVAAGGVLTVQNYTTGGGRVTETGATLNLDGSLVLAALSTISRSGGIVSVGGTLALGGGTLAVGGTAALGQLRDVGVIANGTVADGGGGMVFYGAAEGELLNVTYQGLLNLTPALSSLIVQGLTVTGAGGSGAGNVNLLGAGSALTFQGSQTFNNATINMGSNNETTTLSLSDPTGVGAVLTLGATASLQQRGAMAQIDIGRGLGDALVNDGLIAANDPNGRMIVLGGTFTNAGKIVVSSGDTLALEADSVSNLVGNILTTGYWEVDAGSTLNLGMDDAILNMNAVMVLNGPGSQVLYYNTTTYQTMSLEQTLNYVGSAGVLVLENGRTFSDPGLFFVVGQVILSAGALSGNPIAIGATGLVYGSGTITAGDIYNSGHVLAQNGALVLNAPLLGGSPVGNALIAAGSTLVANQALAIPLQFQANTGTLTLAQPTSMTGMIYSFTGSDAIDLVNVGTAGLTLGYAPGSGNGVLTVKSGTVTDATLHFNGNYVAANFLFQPDGHGGTLILDPPVPAPSMASMVGDWNVTPSDLGGAAPVASSGSAGQGGTLAGGSVIGAPPEPAQTTLLVHA